jgi:hypothetical protein
VQLRLGRKVAVDGCGVIVGDAIAAEFGRPQLDRQMHPFQPLGREEAAEQRIGDHGRLDARIVDQRLCGNSVQPGFGAARLCRALGTPLRKNIAEIDLAADQGESGEAAARKAEETDAVATDLRPLGQAPSMKSISRLMSTGRSVSADRGSLWSCSGEWLLSLG